MVGVLMVFQCQFVIKWNKVHEFNGHYFHRPKQCAGKFVIGGLFRFHLITSVAYRNQLPASVKMNREIIINLKDRILQ
jgi:hypothetical protein